MRDIVICGSFDDRKYVYGVGEGLLSPENKVHLPNFWLERRPSPSEQFSLIHTHLTKVRRADHFVACFRTKCGANTLMELGYFLATHSEDSRIFILYGTAVELPDEFRTMGFYLGNLDIPAEGAVWIQSNLP